MYKTAKRIKKYTNKHNFQNNNDFKKDADNQDDNLLNNNKFSLKDEIENFKGMSFIKKVKSNQNNINSYL